MKNRVAYENVFKCITLLLEGKMTRGGRLLDFLYFCQAASIRQAEFVNWPFKTDLIFIFEFLQGDSIPAVRCQQDEVV